MMIDLFYEGGPLFMGLLTIVLLIVFVLGTMSFIAIKKGRAQDKVTLQGVNMVRSVGLFGLILGIFAQLMSLYQMLNAIEKIGNVAPALLAGGLKVSMLTTEYGAVIFLIAYLLWFGLKAMACKTEQA